MLPETGGDAGPVGHCSGVNRTDPGDTQEPGNQDTPRVVGAGWWNGPGRLHRTVDQQAYRTVRRCLLDHGRTNLRPTGEHTGRVEPQAGQTTLAQQVTAHRAGVTGREQ